MTFVVGPSLGAILVGYEFKIFYSMKIGSHREKTGDVVLLRTKCTDKPVHPHSLISVFAICSRKV